MSEFIDAIDDAQPPRFELPRLQIIHLMAWMAATAVAFVPYRAQQERLAQMASTREFVDNPAATVQGLWTGVLQGAFLFVTAAMLLWRRRGYAGRLQPGHYFAYQGSALWAATLVAVASIWLPTDGGRSGWRMLLAIPRVAVAIIFFVWFLRLSRRHTVAPAWRRAFAVAALTPVAAGIFVVCGTIVGFRGNPSALLPAIFLIQGSAVILVALTLAVAMWDDRRRGAAQHWSHWIGAGARLVESCGYCLVYAAALLFWALR
jgi:hypothetical protein